MNKHKVRSLILLFSATALIFGCNPGDPFDPVAQLNSDIQAIDAQLASTPGVVKHVSGVSLVITQLGDGLPASLYMDPVVEVGYVGKLFSTGGTFEQGTVNPPETTTPIKLSGLISGWQIALSMLPVGSKATVYIPSYYAYGNSGQGTIPPNSILIFDLDFKAVKLTSAQTSKFKADSTTIKNYLTENNIEATYDSAGMWYHITSPTPGPKPTLYDKVKIKYTFKKLTPAQDVIKTFEEAPDAGKFDSRVSDYLNAMKVGLMNMNEGSKATFYIPSNLAFATHAVGDATGAEIIAANTNLVVDMELQDIVE